MMTSCLAQASANNGDLKGCRMPAFDAAFEPATAGGDAGRDASSNAADGGDAGRDGG